MDPIYRKTLRALLKRHNITPNKTLGQHFLIKSTVRKAFLATVAPRPEERVLEVGPGVGSLTIALAHHVRAITVVEKGRALLPPLEEILSENDINNVSVVRDDVLSYLSDASAIFDVVAGALPYYLTSRFFRVLLEESPLQWNRGVFIIQREVAERITARPPDMNLLGLSVQLFATPSIVAVIPPDAFWPQPNVASALLFIKPPTKRDSDTTLEQKQTVLTLARRAFQQKRKQLKNTLSPDHLDAAGIPQEKRPQELSLDDWKQLADNTKHLS